MIINNTTRKLYILYSAYSLCDKGKLKFIIVITEMWHVISSLMLFSPILLFTFQLPEAHPVLYSLQKGSIYHKLWRTCLLAAAFRVRRFWTWRRSWLDLTLLTSSELEEVGSPLCAEVTCSHSRKCLSVVEFGC